MTISLGIFGDSYAEVIKGVPDWARGWPDLLGEEYLITNYAWSASSFEYTYKQFMRNHAVHEQVVVLVTNPHRFGHEPMTIDGKPVWINSVGTLEGLHHSGKGLLSIEDMNRLDALRNYWVYLQQLNGVFLTAPLMLAEIRRQRPDALIIPCFPWPYANDVFETSPTMQDLQSACLRGLRSDWLCDDAFWNQGVYPYKEKSMLCHLTLEANQIMAASVQLHLEQGQERWRPRWPHKIESDRLWQDYLMENNHPSNINMTGIELFVSFFNTR